jgi:hypothetical protein
MGRRRENPPGPWLSRDVTVARFPVPHLHWTGSMPGRANNQLHVPTLHMRLAIQGDMPRRRWPLAQPSRSRRPWRARTNDNARRRLAAINGRRAMYFPDGAYMYLLRCPLATTRPVAVARQLGGPAVECIWAAAGIAGQGVERSPDGDCDDDDDDAPATTVSIGMGKAWIARSEETNGWAIAEGSSTRALGRDGRQQAQFATCRPVLRSHGDAAAVPGVWTTRLLPTWSSCVSLHAADDDDDNSQSNTPCESCDVLSTIVCRLVMSSKSGHAMFDTEAISIAYCA